MWKALHTLCPCCGQAAWVASEIVSVARMNHFFQILFPYSFQLGWARDIPVREQRAEVMGSHLWLIYRLTCWVQRLSLQLPHIPLRPGSGMCLVYLCGVLQDNYIVKGGHEN